MNGHREDTSRRVEQETINQKLFPSIKIDLTYKIIKESSSVIKICFFLIIKLQCNIEKLIYLKV